jgi:hypothetical protein
LIKTLQSNAPFEAHFSHTQLLFFDSSGTLFSNSSVITALMHQHDAALPATAPQALPSPQRGQMFGDTDG